MKKTIELNHLGRHKPLQSCEGMLIKHSGAVGCCEETFLDVVTDPHQSQNAVSCVPKCHKNIACCLSWRGKCVSVRKTAECL